LDDIELKISTTVNVDPLKRQSSESVSSGSVSKRDKISLSIQSTLNSGVSDDAELDNITQQNLLDMVKDMPETRSDVTAIGQKLADDPNYPSEEALDKIANLMVDQSADWMNGIDAEEDTSSENA
jgi:hypothetical protein